jgi:hypothetical protein
MLPSCNPGFASGGCDLLATRAGGGLGELCQNPACKFATEVDQDGLGLGAGEILDESF